MLIAVEVYMVAVFLDMLLTAEWIVHLCYAWMVNLTSMLVVAFISGPLQWY